MNNAVIFTYSFDSEVAVYLFETWDKAWEFLKDAYENELRIDVEENGWDSYGFIDKEEGTAYIYTRFADNTDKTSMMIGTIYQ